MFLCRIMTKCFLLNHYKYSFNSIKHFCVIYDKNFDYFRSRNEYKNSVVQFNNDLNQSKVAGPGFSFLLKEHNIQTDGYFSHLIQRENVMKLSPTQVKDLLFLMANIKVDTSKYATILGYLDEKCALSIERWPLDLSFYVLDAWFIILGTKAFRKHYYSAITSVWGRKMNKCSKFNLVLMLYFIGMSKVAPPFLMELIENKMEGLLSEFSDEEMAVACLSFFKTSKKIDSDLILEKSCKAAKHLLTKSDRFNVISILKCLRLSKYYDEELWQMVKDYTIRECEMFNFVECTNFLAIFSTNNMYDLELFKCLENRGFVCLEAEAIVLKEAGYEISVKTHPSIRSRVKDVTRFMWTLSSMGHLIEKSRLSFISDIIWQRVKNGEFVSQTNVLIDCLQSFVLFGYYPHNIFAAVLTNDTLRRLYYLDKSKPLYQLYFIQKSTLIEEPDLKTKLKSIFKPIPKTLENDIKQRKGYSNLINILNKTSIEFFNCFLLPHIMISGFLVGNNKSSSKDNSEINFARKLVESRIISNQALDFICNHINYVCVEVLDPSVCVNSGETPLGLMKTKIRHLQKLNFNVLTLSTNQIDALSKKNIPKHYTNIQELAKL